MVSVTATVVAAMIEIPHHKRSRSTCCCSARKSVSAHTRRMLVRQRDARKCRSARRSERLHFRRFERSPRTRYTLWCRERRRCGVPQNHPNRVPTCAPYALESFLHVRDARVSHSRTEDRVRNRKDAGKPCRRLLECSDDNDG